MFRKSAISYLQRKLNDEKTRYTVLQCQAPFKFMVVSTECFTASGSSETLIKSVKINFQT